MLLKFTGKQYACQNRLPTLEARWFLPDFGTSGHFPNVWVLHAIHCGLYMNYSYNVSVVMTEHTLYNHVCEKKRFTMQMCTDTSTINWIVEEMTDSGNVRDACLLWEGGKVGDFHEKSEKSKCCHEKSVLAYIVV